MSTYIDDEKRFKQAMAHVGADMGVVKRWLKTYSKAKKNCIAVSNRYYNTRGSLESLLKSLNNLEDILATGDELDEKAKQTFSNEIKDFKKMQHSFDDEFLISKADTDFHSTLESVIKLAENKDISANRILLKSEIENLIHFTKEGLERKHPDLFALAYFYMEHTDSELAEMNFEQKAEHVMNLYETEFIAAIMPELLAGIDKAQSMYEKCSKANDRRSAKTIAEIEPLLCKGAEGLSDDKKAKVVLAMLCLV